MASVTMMDTFALVDLTISWPSSEARTSNVYSEISSLSSVPTVNIEPVCSSIAKAPIQELVLFFVPESNDESNSNGFSIEYLSLELRPKSGSEAEMRSTSVPTEISSFTERIQTSYIQLVSAKHQAEPERLYAKKLNC